MYSASDTAPVALPEVVAETEQSGAFLVTPFRHLSDQIVKVVDIVHAEDLRSGTSNSATGNTVSLFKNSRH